MTDHAHPDWKAGFTGITADGRLTKAPESRPPVATIAHVVQEVSHALQREGVTQTPAVQGGVYSVHTETYGRVVFRLDFIDMTKFVRVPHHPV